MQHVTQLGHRITFDWTAAEWDDEENRTRLARMERTGCLVADVGILVFPRQDELTGTRPTLVGALIEAGMMLGHGKPLILFGDQDDCQRSVFWRLPEVRHAPNLTYLDDCLKAALKYPQMGGLLFDRA
jgi:hypothetical protein